MTRRATCRGTVALLCSVHFSNDEAREVRSRSHHTLEAPSCGECSAMTEPRNERQWGFGNGLK